MRFEGKFDPPAIGRTRVPIRIAGPGSCDVSANGLEVTGAQTPNVGALYWLMLAAFFVGAVAVKIVLRPPDWAYYAILGAGIAVVIGAGTAIGQKRKLGKAITLQIPWSSISNFAAEAETPDTVVITVKKFNPKGDLFFTPQHGAKGFLEALQAQKRD
jgi:hypothetical protein